MPARRRSTRSSAKAVVTPRATRSTRSSETAELSHEVQPRKRQKVAKKSTVVAAKEEVKAVKPNLKQDKKDADKLIAQLKKSQVRKIFRLKDINIYIYLVYIDIYLHNMYNMNEIHYYCVR